LAVGFVSTTPTICTSSGARGHLIKLLKVGTCTVKATQAGSAIYLAASPVSRSFRVTATAGLRARKYDRPFVAPAVGHPVAQGTSRAV
jgi:hypothetical protein